MTTVFLQVIENELDQIDTEDMEQELKMSQPKGAEERNKMSQPKVEQEREWSESTKHTGCLGRERNQQPNWEADCNNKWSGKILVK